MKPILYNTPMVRAILDRLKTQTRRLIRPQPPEDAIVTFVRAEGPEGLCGMVWQTDHSRGYQAAPYQPGDVLWVRETWARNPCLFEKWRYIYRADCHPADVADQKWRPSIHMPKAAARIFLRVTAVRVERLQDSFNAPITPILAVQAEGIDIGDTCRECLETYICPCCVEALDDDGTTLGECGMLDENRGEFSDLWDSTIKPADRDRFGWEANPWVFAYTFEQINKEETEK